MGETGSRSAALSGNRSLGLRYAGFGDDDVALVQQLVEAAVGHDGDRGDPLHRGPSVVSHSVSHRLHLDVVFGTVLTVSAALAGLSALALAYPMLATLPLARPTG